MAGNSLGDLVISVATDLNPLASGLKKIPSLFDMALRGGAWEAGKGLAETIFGAPKDFISDAVKLQASWERSSTEFEVFLGSAAKAQSLMVDLRRFAAESPLKLSETVSEAKKLLSSGISEGQLIPTMQMLSDLSVGNNYTLHALTKAYTDVIAAGRLYGTELRQFTETGIPLIEALAATLKKPKEEIRSLMESGRIGSGELQKALKSLVSEGGKFYRMTERGSLTLEGQFEKLRDNVEELKREFGRAIIEEAGLRDAVQDGSKFTDEMRRFINDLRPGIHFIADVIKGAANVVGELIRNGPLFGKALMESLTGVNPELAAVFTKVGTFVESLKNFRLDPRAVVRAAIDFGRAFGEAVDSVIKSLGDGLSSIYNDNVKPIVDALKDAALTWKNVKAVMDAPGKFGNEVGWQFGQEWEKNFGKGKPTEQAFLDSRRKDFSGVGDLWETGVKKLTDQMAGMRGDDPQFKELSGKLSALNKGYDEFARKRDEMIVTQFRAKWNPSKENFDAVQSQILPGLEKAQLKAAQDFVASLKAAGVDASEAIKLNGVPVEATRPEMAGPASKAKAFVDDLESRLFGLADRLDRDRGKSPEQVAAEKAAGDAKSAMGLLAGATFEAAKTLKDAEFKDALSALTGAAAGTVKAFKKAELVIDEFGRFNAKLVELKPVLDAPSKQFTEQWNDLVKMRDLDRQGKFKFSERDLALAGADLFKKFAPAMLEAKLPTAAEYGSQQAAELYARANSFGGASATTLLQQMLEVEKQQLDQARRMVEEFRSSNPGVIQLPPP